jgi:formate--tetrahydrofolate ligase
MDEKGTEEMMSTLEIARRARLKPIEEISGRMGIEPRFLTHYGEYIAKVDPEALTELEDRPRARYVLVTAITPTPLGEGKTTTSLGLGEAMGQIGRRATVSIRQGSMGPTFGIKGAAAGGGYSQAVPFEPLALHFTGDTHAITAAHNLLAAMVDNHLHQGNELGLDSHEITWRRVLDVDDRALRNVIVGLGDRKDGVPRQTGFDISAASEVMAIVALSKSVPDLRARLGRVVIGFTKDGAPVTAEELRAAGAMTVMLLDAIKPNLVQTLENTPVIVHAGPFGNIAHGNSSVLGDLIGIHAGEYLITEAGFAADMGAERFFNLKCRVSGLEPDVGVVVATVRALKAHSGRYRIIAGRPLPDGLLDENPDDVAAGVGNLRHHVEILRTHGIPAVIALNSSPGDFESEYDVVRELGRELGVPVAVARNFELGGKGATELAEAVVQEAEKPHDFRFLYDLDSPLKEKVNTIATRVYGADRVEYSARAERELASYEAKGFGHLPICIAKTQYSLSADASLKGVPTGWALPVREVRLSAGAGFVYPICGDIATMPGLGSHPTAFDIDIDETGQIVGLS